MTLNVSVYDTQSWALALIGGATLVSVVSGFSDMLTFHPVCASARPPKKCCTLGLVPTLSILLYPFAAVWDSLSELTMEVLQPRVQWMWWSRALVCPVLPH